MDPQFLDGSYLKGSPLQDDSARARLQQAILDNDPERFRGILQQAAPQRDCLALALHRRR